MNRLFIIGNLTRDPESRITKDGVKVCSFSVAVNRYAPAGHKPQPDFFRVTAWRQLGENCEKYLSKGRKVAVVGSVSVSTYQGNDGKTHATLEVTAEDVEFLSPKEQPQENTANAVSSQPAGKEYVEVSGEDLPW